MSNLISNLVVRSFTASVICRGQLEVQKTECLQRAITSIKEGKLQPKSNLISNSSLRGFTAIFMTISGKITEKSSENQSVTDRWVDRQKERHSGNL